MGVPEMESCTDWGWGNGENSLVTMDSARKDGRGITGQAAVPSSKKTRGDPQTPAGARSEVKCRVKGKVHGDASIQRLGWRHRA